MDKGRHEGRSLLHAGNNLDKARLLFEAAIEHLTSPAPAIAAPHYPARCECRAILPAEYSAARSVEVEEDWGNCWRPRQALSVKTLLKIVKLFSGGSS